MHQQPLDALIADCIVTARLEAGESPALLLARADDSAEARRIRRAAHIARRGLSHANRPWTADERRYLRRHARSRSVREIAAVLGRTPSAVHIRRTRAGLGSPRGNPEHVTARDVTRLLGVGCSKTVHRWMDSGMLPSRYESYDRVWRVTSPHSLTRFAVNPANWVHFDPDAVTDPRLRRLIALRRERWGDEWWTTGQAAAWHAEQRGEPIACSTIHDYISAGRLPAVRSGNWYVRKSCAMTLELYTGKGRYNAMTAGPNVAQRQWLILCRAVGLTQGAAAELCGLKFNTGYHYARYYVNHPSTAEFLEQHPVPGVHFRPDDCALYADWRDHAPRIPSVGRAMTLFLDGDIGRGPIDERARRRWQRPRRDQLIVRAVLYNWAVWHAPLTDRDPDAVQATLRKLSKALHATPRNLAAARDELLTWFAPGSAETAPLRKEVPT